MRRRLAAWLFPLLPLLPPNGPAYRIDSDRSQAVFGVRLLWLRDVSGRFTRIDGTVTPGPRADSVVVNANITTDSVVMASARLRRWVLAPEFFDVADYPTIRFVSDPFPRATLAQGGALPGRLSLRGVTEPVLFTLRPVHCPSITAATCRIELYGSLQRADFGMTGHDLTLSNRVELNLSIALLPARD